MLFKLVKKLNLNLCMDNYLFFFSFLFSCSLIYLFQYLFFLKKRIDEINYRSSHEVLATRSGGVSIFSAVFLISLFFYFKGVQLFDYSLFIPLGILFLLGLYDDLYLVDFKIKFLMQIIVAKILIDQGFVINSLHGLFGFYEIPWILAQSFTVIFFVIFVNAYNFIDGVDGLAITETLKNLLFFIIFLPSENELLFLFQLLISILIPLYYFNLKKEKKVFLGDAGSLFLGGINLVLILHTLNPNTSLINESINKVLLVLVIMLYPLCDLIRVVFVRLKNNKSPFEADKNHIHHLLLKVGLSHVFATFIICGIGAIILFGILTV